MRTHYRVFRWTPLDLVVSVAAAATLVIALVLGR
jgi:hypothetical protein